MALRRAVTGHLLVDVVLNGRPATFVLDGGTDDSTIDASEAPQVGVPANDASGRAWHRLDATRRLKARLVTIRSLEVGRVAAGLNDISGRPTLSQSSQPPYNSGENSVRHNR